MASCNPNMFLIKVWHVSKYNMTCIEEVRVAETANVFPLCVVTPKSPVIYWKEGGPPKKLFLGLISIVNWPYLGGQNGGVK